MNGVQGERTSAPAVAVLRTMTLNQLMEEIRGRGMPMSYEKLTAMIASDLLPFVEVVRMKHDEYIIWRKGFEEWAAAHSVMEEPI